MEIPIPDYDGPVEDVAATANVSVKTANESDRYRLSVEETPSPNIVRVTSKHESEVVVAQPVLVEGDRAKMGSARRSQMQVVSIRLDSNSDSDSNPRK